MAHLNVKNLNQYDVFDYKMPMCLKETDYRTAKDRSHQFYHQHQVPDPIAVRSNNAILNGNPIHVKHISETTQQYPFKQPLNYQSRAADLPYRLQRLEFNKAWEEKIKSKVLRPIKEYQTTSALLYDEKFLPRELPYVQLPKPSEIEKPLDEVPSNSDGYSKLLDPYISTTHLDHKLFTKEKQLGIAKKNAITFWAWMDYPKTSLGFGLHEKIVKDKLTVEPCYDKRTFKGAVYDREPKKTMKFIPHSAFATECRDNYKLPVSKPFDFGEPIFTPALIPLTDCKGRPESEMYGSGKRVDEILKCKKY